MKACKRSQHERKRRKCEGNEREGVVVVWKIASGKGRRTRNMSEL
jgi:hypothetical protein